MSLNEIILIVVCVVFGALLLCGVMFRIALHYRAQVKALSEEIQYLMARVKKVNTDFILGNRNIIYECDADIGKSEAEIKQLKQEIEERDEEIKQLKQKTEEHEKAFRNVSEVVMTLEADVQSRDEEIQRLTQELKQRDEAVKENSHKNKKSKKKGK
ncbi:coiled-coil domain-containing protein [Bartonella sp. OC16QHHD]|uniref:coiled-coil domain-containing protein n=1 Tax=Bartonella sp. OC16QHHD TaxID=3243562 RepID=UPI0035CFB35D